MNKEYDFSKGVRGKFYHPDVQIKIPVYLDPDIADFIQKYSREKKVDLQTIVNQWSRTNIEMLKSIM